MKAEKQKIWMDVVKDMRLYYYGKEVSSIGIIEDYLRFVSENVRDGNVCNWYLHQITWCSAWPTCAWRGSCVLY